MSEKKYTERNKFGLPNIVIPAEVLLNRNLSPREMILFGYILNMAHNEHGYCWASNRYLSRLIGVIPDTVSTMISKLTKEQYLVLEYETRYDGKQVRKIFINKEYPKIYGETIKKAFSESKDPVGKIKKGVCENPNTPIAKSKGGYGKTQSNIDNIYNKRDNNINTNCQNLKIDNSIPSDDALKLSKYLSQIIQENKNIQILPNQIKKWGIEIDKLFKQGISPNRLEENLIWYKENINNKYTPVIDNGTSLRTKFLRLEAAKDRDKNKIVKNTPKNKYKEWEKKALLI